MTLKEILEELKKLDREGKINLKGVVLITKNGVVVAKNEGSMS